MIGSILLFLIGLFLSAFFSGSETGFYRATRVRLVLDGLGGDPVARGLLRLTNNPSLFVATSLIGNNLANYLTSLAVVLAVQHLPIDSNNMVNLLAPVILSPLVFVYGELLPKALYIQAPNRLLRRSGPLFLLCAVLFLPVSAILWALGRLLQSAIGEAPLQVQLRLARKELNNVIQEGEQIGVLKPLQRQLTDAVTAIGTQPVSKFAVPVTRVAAVKEGDRKQDVLRLARRQRLSVVPVRRSRSGKPTGYVRIIELQLSDSEVVAATNDLIQISDTTSHIAAVTRLQSQKEELACVTDENGEVTGIVYTKDLIAPLFRGE